MNSTMYPNFYRETLLPGSIRLLRLLPHIDKEAQIQCELFHYSPHESGIRTHPYDALSYVWGDPAEMRSIYISEQTSTTQHNLQVTNNLHEVLSRLRYRHFERIIWIDAVCINQEDDREKEQQIQLIPKIYGQANRVLVWLGETADDSDQALQEIRSAGGYKLETPSNHELNRQALTALFRRPWFHRIWVWKSVLVTIYKIS